MFIVMNYEQMKEIRTPTKAASKYETLISTETPVVVTLSIVMITDEPTTSTSAAVAPPCKELPTFFNP